jgi:histidinol-phosphate/aromatic aminotransferase/cobyric acid decarboxylase-like protein
MPLENCLVLRSMTKDFALAGLRMGYALARPDLIEKLKSYQPAWSVNAIAQAAGVAALSDIDYYYQTLTNLKQLSREFFAQIEERGGLL